MGHLAAAARPRRPPGVPAAVRAARRPGRAGIGQHPYRGGVVGTGMNTCHPSAPDAPPAAVPPQALALPLVHQEFGSAGGPAVRRPAAVRAPQQTQSWTTSAAEQASDVLSGLRTVEVPMAALQAALLILTELVARPHESTGMREAAREICGVFAGLTDPAL